MHLPVKGILGIVSLPQTKATCFDQWMVYTMCTRIREQWIMRNHATFHILIWTHLWQTWTDYVSWLLMVHCEYIIVYKVLLQNGVNICDVIFWAISLFSWLKTVNSSRMLDTDMVSETSVIFSQLTWLIAKEDVVTPSRHENFRSCSVCDIWIP